MLPHAQDLKIFFGVGYGLRTTDLDAGVGFINTFSASFIRHRLPPEKKRWGRRSRARVIDGPENETQTNHTEFNLYFFICQEKNKKADQSHFESLLTFVSVWMVGGYYFLISSRNL
jgi:hypothetical protein